jgi:hypothetical protein
MKENNNLDSTVGAIEPIQAEKPTEQKTSPPSSIAIEPRKIESNYRGIIFEVQGHGLKPDTVREIVEDARLKSLIIKIDTPRGGMLDIKLPTEILDALPNDDGKDPKFFVLIDGEDTKFTKSRLSAANPLSLQVSFPKEATTIEVFGIEIPEPSPVDESLLAVSAIAAAMIGMSLAVAFIAKRKKHVATA